VNLGKPLATRLRACLAHQWQHGGCLSHLLLPLSGLTWLVVRAKAKHYARNKRSIWRAPVPVVVVGNILVGGTGKTPVVMAVVRALQARGWHPGVISRGYGVKLGPKPRVARGPASPAEIGDEPALIATATGVPVAVHPRRPLAAQALLQTWPETDVLIADDGLQHLALGRDVEILVQDARATGNGRLLPAGPLREPAARLKTVDAVVTNLGTAQSNFPRPDHPAPPRQVGMRLVLDSCIRLRDGLRLAPDVFAQTMAGQRVAAAAGIGQPERFFATLQAAGITLVDTLALPDHYHYRQSPFDSLDAQAILLTSKDAVKCATLGDARLWYVDVSPVFDDHSFFAWLDARLRAVRAPPASSN